MRYVWGGQLRTFVVASGERFTLPAGTRFPLVSLTIVSCEVRYVVSSNDLVRILTAGATVVVGTGVCGQNGLQACVWLNGTKLTSICLSASS